jgi:hypothetical protein
MCLSAILTHVAQDDNSEIDIEILTPGDSVFSNTINYSVHPVENLDGSLIINATTSRSLPEIHLDTNQFHEYRFDSHPTRGASFYVDGELAHESSHNIPTLGGRLHVNLWADGNNGWAGMPSTTDVFLSMKSIIAYYNTSSPDAEWAEACNGAGGPSKQTICLVR